MTSNFNSPNDGEKIHVNSYTKRDGTDVSSYYRSRPGQGGFLPEPDKNYLDNPLIMQGVQQNMQNVYDYFTVDEYGRNVADKLQKNVYVDVLGHTRDKHGKAATEFLYNAVNDFEYAKNDPNAEVYESGKSIPNANLRTFITTDPNITNYGTIDVKNMKGAYYNSNSAVSKSMSQNFLLNPKNVEKILQNEMVLKENAQKIKDKDKNIPKSVEKYYGNQYVFSMSVKMTDLYNKYDIGNFTLYNPRIDSDGHLRAHAIDIVDYVHQNYTDIPYAYVPNEWGVKMQNNKYFPKTFNIIEIDIPDVMNKLKK